MKIALLLFIPSPVFCGVMTDATVPSAAWTDTTDAVASPAWAAPTACPISRPSLPDEFCGGAGLFASVGVFLPHSAQKDAAPPKRVAPQ